MGWASGSGLMDEVIRGALEAMPKQPESRKILYRIVIKAFEQGDCDTLDECVGQDEAFDAVFAGKGRG